MIYLSGDLAAAAGYAVWDNGLLLEAGEVVRRTKKSRWVQTFVYQPGRDESLLLWKMSEREAWERILVEQGWPLLGVEYLVLEAVHVRFKREAIAIGELHGRVISHLGFSSLYDRVEKVEPTKWRLTAKDTLGAKWPKQKKGATATAAYKAEADRLVNEHWKIDGGNNVSDAVLIGHWWNIEHAPFTLPESYPGVGGKRP